MKNLIQKLTTLVAASAISCIAIQAASAGGEIDAGESYQPTVWKGMYLGGHIGGTFGEVSEGGFEEDVEGVIGGVHLGYNIENGSTVFGIEGDFSFSDANIDNTDVDLDFLASIRGRVGYATNKTLIFATAGVAWAQFSFDNDEISEAGYVVGAGVEHKFADNVSIRGEILHYGFEFDEDDVDYDATVIRTGLSWHLN